MRWNTGGGGGGGGGSSLALPVATIPRSYLRIPTALEGGAPSAQPVNYDDLAQAFGVTLGPGRSLDVGQHLIDPAFTSTYTATPLVSAVLTDNFGSVPRNLLAASSDFPSDTAFAFHAKGDFVRTVPGQSVTWANTANAGGGTHGATATATWLARAYYGSLSPAQLAADDATLAAAVAALPSRLTTGRGGLYPANPGPTDYGVIWFPTSFGAPGSFTVTTTVNGTPTVNLPGGMSLFRLLSVTNGYGVTLPGGLYRVDAVGLAGSWAVT